MPAAASTTKSHPPRLVRNPRSSVVTRWQDRPHLQLQVASEIAGVSEASLYRAASDGQLTLVRLAGRTLVETKSFIAFIGTAVPWTPSDRGAAARAKRAEAARAALR